jgi:hypothetical protein
MEHEWGGWNSLCELGIGLMGLNFAIIMIIIIIIRRMD